MIQNPSAAAATPTLARATPTLARAATAMPSRVAGFAIMGTTFDVIAETEKQKALIWQLMDLCVAAEQRARNCFGSDKAKDAMIPTALAMIPGALAVINIFFTFGKPSNLSILGPLTSDFPELIRSLRVLVLLGNAYDESTDLGSLAAVATQLQELIFWWGGLSSVRGLEGRCERLRRVDFMSCKALQSLEGLGHHIHLQEVHISGTPVTSLEPLRWCPALTAVSLRWCPQLASLDGIGEWHQELKEVDAAGIPIASIEPLRTCPALTKVDLSYCEHIPTNVDLPAHITVTRL